MTRPSRSTKIKVVAALVLVMVGAAVALYVLNPAGGTCGWMNGVPVLCGGEAASPLLVIALTTIAAGVAAAATALSAREERMEGTVPEPKDRR